MAISLTSQQLAALKAQPASQQAMFRAGTNAQQTAWMNSYVAQYEKANPPKVAAPIQYTDVVSYSPITGATTTRQFQTTDPYSQGYTTAADLAFYQQQAADSKVIYDRYVADQQRQAQLAVEQQQAREAAAAKAQADALAAQQAAADAALKKQQALDAAQAAFKLPDPSSVQADANGQMKATSPNGTQFFAVPADPITGAKAQWYQMGTDAKGYPNYTSVGQDLKPVTTATGPVAPLDYGQFGTLQNTVTKNIDTNRINNYIASIPTTTVSSTDLTTGKPVDRVFQTQDRSLSNYISPEDLTFYQQQAAESKTLYDQQQAEKTRQQIALEKQQAENKLLAATQLADQLNRHPGDGVALGVPGYVDESGQTGTPVGPIAPGSVATSLMREGGMGPPAVATFDPTTPVTKTSGPVYEAINNVVWYPTASGWQQSGNPQLSGYTTADKIQMQLPTAELGTLTRDANTSRWQGQSKPIVSPTGEVFYPKLAVPGSGQASTWASGPQAAAQYAGFMDGPASTFVGKDVEKVDALTGQTVQTYNPYASAQVPTNGIGGTAATYMSPEQYQANQIEWNRQQEEARMAAMNSDDIFAQFDKLVNKTVGWKTIATIAGSAFGGPLGAALANAAAGAVAGESLESIVKGAAMTYALAYGTEALGEALNQTVSTGIDQGLVDADVGGSFLEGSAEVIPTEAVAPDVVSEFTTPVEAPVAPETPTIDNITQSRGGKIYDYSDGSQYVETNSGQVIEVKGPGGVDAGRQVVGSLPSDIPTPPAVPTPPTESFVPVSDVPPAPIEAVAPGETIWSDIPGQEVELPRNPDMIQVVLKYNYNNQILYLLNLWHQV